MPERVKRPFGDVFGPEAVSAEMAAFNRQAAQVMQGMPRLWDIGVEAARTGGFMPRAPRSERAVERDIGGGVRIRIVPADSPRGLYLHVHGGGLVLGSAADQDPMLERIARQVQVTCVSVEYRLAPEHPYPAAWEDCEAAALWLARNGKAEFGTDALLIGGESAGAMLAVATLVRMRDRHGYRAFRGANLSFGNYDATMTPSQIKATSGLIRTADIARNTAAYCPDAQQLRNPDVSPLYADLRSLPPALFTVGTLDAFLDDSMFMYCRWLSAGNSAEIAIWPGADHAFIDTPGGGPGPPAPTPIHIPGRFRPAPPAHPLAAPAIARIDAFLDDCLRGETLDAGR